MNKNHIHLDYRTGHGSGINLPILCPIFYKDKNSSRVGLGWVKVRTFAWVKYIYFYPTQ